MQKGFTLIEVIIVIAILGILGALIVPRFSQIDSEARAAATKSLAGSLRSASTIAHVAFLATTPPETAGGVSTVDMEGDVVLRYRYPAASNAGIMAAVGYPSGSIPGFVVTPDTNSITFRHESTDSTSCQVIFAQAVNNGAIPTITIDTSGC